MGEPLHTVVETPAYLGDANALGLTEEIRRAIVDFVAATPYAGDEIRSSGGVRKFRFAGRGKGKSGGYRIMSLYLGDDFPVYLLAILSKGERGNFSMAEIAAFKKMADQLKHLLRTKRQR